MNDSAHAFWIGAYTTDGNGTASGIGRAVAAADGALAQPVLAVPDDSPSFVALHPTLPVLYAVEEFAGTVRAFAVDGTQLRPLGDAWAAGAAACHINVDPAGRFAVATCWGDGRVVTYGLDEHGAISSRTQAEPAHDPHPGTPTPEGQPERTSRAHMSLMLPDGRVLTTDLGYDLLRVWRYEAGAGLLPDHEVVLPAGSGPRHLALHPSGHVYVVTEYSNAVLIIAADATGRLTHVGTVPVTKGGAADGDAAAHITVDAAGERVHVTVRGRNLLAELTVLDGGAALEPCWAVPSGVDWPRHHLLVESAEAAHIHVTGQLSSTVSTFELGEPGSEPRLIGVTPVASPTCLVPAR
jgi:6-phosphogluconolactonase (cycloisomerase 2 family)